jgi:hypothetical protein
MTIEVEIVGGPRDGERVALPDGIKELRYPLVTNPNVLNEKWDAETETSYRTSLESLNIREVRLPIRLTSNGYRAYWREPSC